MTPKRKLYRSTLEEFMAAHGHGADRYARELNLMIPMLMAFSLVSILLIPFALLGGAWWYERRLAHTRRRIIDERLCLECGYALHATPSDANGNGSCPECGRSFTLAVYEEAP